MKKIKIVLKKQNNKKEIYEEVIEYNENIENIDLSNQNLIEIPKGLEQFKNLEILYLYKNNISKIQFLTTDGKSFNENHLINLKELWLNNNQITKIENIDKNINLQELYLYDNQITKIENIHHLEKLEYFRLFDEDQNENIKESLSISLNNYNLELKEKQIQKELLKQKQDKEYFDNNYQQIKQQFISFNISNDNELII